MKQEKTVVHNNDEFYNLVDKDHFADPFIQSVVFVKSDIEDLKHLVVGNNVRFIGKEGVKNMSKIKFKGSNISFSFTCLEDCSIERVERFCSHKNFFIDVDFKECDISNLYHSKFTGVEIRDCSNMNFNAVTFYDASRSKEYTLVTDSYNINFNNCKSKVKNGCSSDHAFHIEDSYHIEINESYIEGGDFGVSSKDSSVGIIDTEIRDSENVAVDIPESKYMPENNSVVVLENCKFKNNNQIVTENRLGSDKLDVNNCPQIFVEKI